MVAQATRVERIQTPSEADALILEDNLIKQHLPEYNRLLRNNSQYVFLKISPGPFPTFRIVKKRANDGSTYIGPRYNSKQLRELLRYLRQIYQFHTMKPREFAKWTLSSDYFFGLDKGRSVIALLNQPQKHHLVEQAKRQWRTQTATYESYVDEYKKITTLVRNCFEGKTQKVLQTLHQEIDIAIWKQHFERCSRLRDIYTFVQSLETTYQHIVFSQPRTWYVAHIEHIAHSWIILLIQITEWKVVDIIRTHVWFEEQEVSTIISWLQAEFGCTSEIIQTAKKHILITPSLKWLRKKDLQQLNELAETAQQSYIATTVNLHEQNVMEQLLMTLQDTYHLKHIPLHMECIDISHLQGDAISGWLSCFRSGLSDKLLYRRYKITTVSSWHADDYQSLKELITRRFKLSKTQIGSTLLPDLLIIDGGKGQLGILRDLCTAYPPLLELMNQIDIVALGKGEARQRSRKLAGAPEIIYTFGDNREIHEYPLSYDHADQLLVNLRDEAHRFANTYRKKQQEKPWK